MPRAKQLQDKVDKNCATRPWMTERDVLLLKSIYSYRLMRRWEAQELFFAKTKYGTLFKEADARRTANRRLQRLVLEGYLTCIRVPEDPRLGDVNGQGVYGLNRKGAEFLCAEGVISEDEVKRYPDRNLITRDSYKRHMRWVNQFRTVFMTAAETRGDSIDQVVTELEWQREPVKVADPTSGTEYNIEPDLSLVYKMGDEEQYLPLFVEVDLRTESHKVFLEKIKGYRLYYELGLFARETGGKHFRVLVVTTSELGVRNLKRATEEAGGKKMFCFTHLNALQKEVILDEPVWERATVEGKSQLFWPKSREQAG